MRWWLLACAACYHADPPVVAPVVAPAPTGSCAIHDGDVTVQTELHLSVGGREFATRGGSFQRVDLAIDARGGHVTVQDEQVELIGDVDLDDVPLRTRAATPYAGWVLVQHAFAHPTQGSRVRLDVILPAGIEPERVAPEYPCAELTTDAAPYDEMPDDSERELPRDTPIPLRATPDGPVVARLAVPTGDDVDAATTVHVLDRRGGFARIRIDGQNPVLAWVSAATVSSQPPQYGLGGGGRGYGIGAGRSFHCRAPLALWVRVAGRPTRVGTLAAGTALTFAERGELAGLPTEVPLSFGGRDVAPFAWLSELAACVE